MLNKNELIETTQVTHYPIPGESMDPEGEEPLSDEWFIARGYYDALPYARGG